MIRKLLDLSTAHLPPEVAEDLTLEVIKLPCSLKEDEYGFFFAVLAGMDDLYPECIRPALKLARDNGCDFILYDRDGPVREDLPTYEW